jgi:hypothetical protein
MTKPKPRMGFTIDPRQHKDKSGCYYGFKTDSGFALMQGPSHMLGGSTRVNPSQHKNKSGYYLSFKT